MPDNVKSTTADWTRGITVIERQPGDNILRGAMNRLFQILARFAPGARTWRVLLHRWRGVRIGRSVWIGYDVIIETAYPWLVSIGDNSEIGLRVVILGHFKRNFDEARGVTIEEDVFIGPGAIILQNVTIGRGAVVTSGSVVTRSVPPKTLVQGNPARPVAICNIPLTGEVSLDEFSRNLQSLDSE
jgi:acetyltransferase-like isoleucine patch superfamily enzyme